MGFKPRKKRYRVLLADPPWQFRDVGTRIAPSYSGSQRADARYPIMSNQAIIDLGDRVMSVVEDDSLLFLWAPGALVLDGTATMVARAWGFEPKQLWEWVKTDKNGKPRLGGGHYGRLVTEPMILCRRGRGRVRRHDIPNVFFAPRTEHSAKPDISYEIVEKLAEGPYLELFARRRRSGWTAWGTELGTWPRSW